MFELCALERKEQEVNQDQRGFIALQLRIGDGTVTMSRDNIDEVMSDLRSLGLSPDETETVVEQYRNGFLSVAGKVPVTAAEGVANVSKPVSQGGLGGRPLVEQGPLCGHGVPREKVSGKYGDFWACRAKDEKGDFLFKKKEGCKPLDMKEYEEQQKKG